MALALIPLRVQNMKELGAFASIGRGKGTKGFGWVM